MQHICDICGTPQDVCRRYDGSGQLPAGLDYGLARGSLHPSPEPGHPSALPVCCLGDRGAQALLVVALHHEGRDKANCLPGRSKSQACSSGEEPGEWN